MREDTPTRTQEPPAAAGRTASSQGVDSILALRDLRHRLVSARKDGSRLSMRSLLELDPLTIIRLLRISRAPINASWSGLRSVDDLIQHFGRIMVMRALEVKPVPIKGSEAVRGQWMHSLATGHACRELAKSRHSIDPEQAYLLGLLVDLPDWVGMLTEFGTAGSERFHRVLEPFMPSLSNRHERRRRALATSQDECTDAEELLCKGELLADLAGYWHPEDADVKAQNALLCEVSRQDLVSAQNLRNQVSTVLEQANLLGAEHRPEHDPQEELPDRQLFEWRRARGNLADVVTSLQSCSTALRYRDIITATTAASLRFLDYERAVLAVWNKELKCCWLRAKSDMTPCALEPLKVYPSVQEQRVLGESLEQGVALRMQAEHQATGLLEALGVDEVLCVPINRAFRSPSFLFLDRTLTRQEIIQGDDLKAVTALASTASILTENLFLKKNGTRAKQFALTDPLTRLFNRGVGLSTLDREIERSKRSQAPLTVLMLDLDEFKNLNDRFGHLRGDAALRLSAEVLRRTLRKQDTVCRYGGEEFMVVLPDTSVEQASIIATRIFTQVERAGLEESMPLTVSIGLTEVDCGEDTVESILVRADHALYASKARGRNRFSVDSIR